MQKKCRDIFNQYSLRMKTLMKAQKNKVKRTLKNTIKSIRNFLIVFNSSKGLNGMNKAFLQIDYYQVSVLTTFFFI